MTKDGQPRDADAAVAPGSRPVLWPTVATTAVVTAASYLTPPAYAATSVGLLFLSATYLLVLRRDSESVRAYGLALGGLLEQDGLDLRRMVREGLRAVAVAAVVFAIVVVPFWLGFWALWAKKQHFVASALVPSADEALGQLLVIALPEEAFFRGWLQTELDARFPRAIRVLGLTVSVGVVITSAVFAVGHFLTIMNPARLAVFFPSLLFGALRKREGGIGASMVFHALCNLLSAGLGRAYGGGHA